MSNLVPPHGSDSLHPLLLPESERAEELKRAASLQKVPMTTREVSDLLMLGMGAYTPLDGFMGEADWRGCCADMQLAGGLFWPIPITLSCAQELGDSIGLGEDVALVDSDTDELLGILTVEEKYSADADFECSHVFRTTDVAHPGVAKVMSQGPVNLGGPVRTFSEGHFPQTYAGLYHRPAETRAMFLEKGWSKVAAFQTRNPMHRSHEYLATFRPRSGSGQSIRLPGTISWRAPCCRPVIPSRCVTRARARPYCTRSSDRISAVHTLWSAVITQESATTTGRTTRITFSTRCHRAACSRNR